MMNEAVRFAAGKKLVLYLSSTSIAQDPSDALYLAAGAARRRDHDRPRDAQRVGSQDGGLPMKLALAATIPLLLAVPAAGATTPGVTATEIVLGGHRAAQRVGIGVCAGR